jgi:hypothetical protein
MLNLTGVKPLFLLKKTPMGGSQSSRAVRRRVVGWSMVQWLASGRVAGPLDVGGGATGGTAAMG